ncbi:MAG TPA: sialidase family protein [Mycobacteriales bacterium]|jgi:hypothetical protein
MRPNVRYWWAAAAAVSVAVLTAPSGTAAERPTKGWDTPVLVSGTQAHRETSLAINPRNPSQMLICDPSGVPAVEDGQSYFHLSTDGGRKWRAIDVEPSSTDTRNAAFEGGDCDVAFDAGGTMYTADTWVGNLSVGSSRNNGESWEGSLVSVTAPVVDRPWLVGGPPGTVYLTYHDLQCCTPSAMWFTKSTDYGRTFSPAVPITTANAAGPYTWEGNFVVSPSGKDLYLVYSRRMSAGVNHPAIPKYAEEISLAASHDGGASWTTLPIADIPRETSSIYPSIGMDAAGWLHVAWAAPRDKDNPVFYTMSKDKGAHWTAPKPLNAGHTGQAPWVAGGRAGEAAIVWLGSPAGQVDAESGWYFYWARVTNGRVTSGTTTRTPMWEGAQTLPEFEMVRLDRQGRMHIGMSVFVAKNRWGVYYQRETSTRH